MPSVLLIEDDQDTRANLCDLLELDGFHVVVASTADQARTFLQDEPEIAIVDRKLPDGLAEDLLPDLRKISPRTDFIVVTGYADMESAITAMRNGATDYILKPIQPEAFRQRLKSIGEVKQLEDDLHREHQFAEQILNTAEAVILVLNLDGTIEQFNPFLTELTQWSLEEVYRKDWFEIFVPEDQRESIRGVFLDTARGMDTQGLVNPILTKDGRLKTVRWSNSTLKDACGNTTAVIAVGHDITDLAASQERALRAERLATIGQMMAALAHESRNALQRIQASTDLLELEVGDNEFAAGDLTKIRRAAASLNILLEEVRAFAAPIQLRKETARLGDVIDQAWDNLSATMECHGASLNVSPECQGLELRLDVLRAEQVFRNLFENSLAATEGQVEIRIGGCSFAQDCVQMFVHDDGPGLTAEQRQRIFDAFFTTKDAGTGLGMAIVQRILEAHGGQIEVDFDYEHGAGFIITLPRN